MSHRNRFWRAAGLSMCVVTAASASQVVPPPISIEQALRPAHVPHEVLIKFQPQATAAGISSVRVQFGAQTLARFRSGGERWRLGENHTEAEALATLRGNPIVAYVEPNYTVSIVTAPNDPRYPELYGLNNTGQLGGTPGADIDAERAWAVSTGSPNVVVAVIDTGVDYTHADLAANIWSNPGEIAGNGIDDDDNGYVDDTRGWDFYNDDNNPMDDHSHGTHCSGTIAGIGDNGIGVAGVAWNVKILPLKFIGYDGYGTTADAVLAIDYATAAHVDVMSNSWGGGEYSQALADAIQAASDAGSLFVAAAGNSGSDNDVYANYPSNYDAPNVVAVAATDRYDQLAYFSSYGASTVDLAAPGVDTLSCLPGNAYGFKSGTSMATPHVSGVAALIRSIAPGIGVVALKERLLATVDALPGLAGITVSGGRLNAFLAIADPDSTPPAAIEDLSIAGATSNSLTVGWTATGDDGTSGTASGYDLRYDITPITNESFALAPRFTATPVPQPPGSHETVEITGLAPGQTYFVAVKAADEWGTTSVLGNVATGDTLPPPTFAWTPESFDADLLTGGVATRLLTLRNAGAGTLDWTIPDGAPEGAGWLSAASHSGRLLAGQQVEVAIVANASGLDGGTYTGAVEVATNDPVRPGTVIPFTLQVTGAPDAAILGPQVRLASTRTYTTDGGTTHHDFPITQAPAGRATLGLTANGDYGDFGETATVTVEGRNLGSAGQTGADCTPATGTFPIDAGTLAALIADGHVAVDVVNTSAVGVFCTANSHEVVLSYHVAASALDFGGVFVGGTATFQLTVENSGTDDLHIVSWGTDRPEFVVEALAPVIPAHESQTVTLAFVPTQLGAVSGVLTLASDDPDTPVATVALTGAGVAPPVIGVAPSSLTSTLDEGSQETQILTLSNSGGSPLQFTITATSQVASLQPQDDPELQVLASSPGPVTCVVADAFAGYLYAQANAGTAFYRYAAASGQWELLASSPIYSGNNGGAALLHGKIYTVYTEDGRMGVYDIATDSWTTVTSPLAYTANITSDGTQALYLVNGSNLVRFDPVTGAITPLPSPPFEFQPWGALVWHQGRVYGHAGNGRTEFGVYDTLMNAWTRLADLPPFGAVLGASIDPATGDYFATGGYYGHDLYRFDAKAGTWSLHASLPFAVDDGGLGWLGGPVPGILIVEGQGGTSLIRLVLGSGVSANPATGTIPPGTSIGVAVTFDASLTPPGVHTGTLRIASNDPVTPVAVVDTSFTVVGHPDIAVDGMTHTASSVVAYTSSAATTSHAFTLEGAVSGAATLTLIADGDFGDSSELATAVAEGVPVGSAGGAGSDCSPTTGFFPIASARFAELAADGVVHVDVTNTVYVDLFCATNRHTLQLTWRSPGDHLDFGRLFIGATRTLTLQVRNDGSIPLHVGAVTADHPAFSSISSGLVVPPRSTTELAVTFAPTAVDAVSATLAIASDDPDTPIVSVALAGEGILAPVIVTSPAAFSESLFTGQSVVRSLAIDNTGGSELTWSAGPTYAFSAESPAPDGRALLIQDAAPWGTAANETVLAANGIPYDRITSSQLAGANLDAYRLVIIPSLQYQPFIDALNAQRAKLDAYVAAGGLLQVHGATYSEETPSYVMPGGVSFVPQFSNVNEVLIPGHPLVAGLGSTVTGNYANHSAIVNVPSGAQVVMKDGFGTPVLIEYRFGRGGVVATGQTIEFYYPSRPSVGVILENAIPYQWNQVPIWLSVSPESGTLPAGGHTELHVRVDAAGLDGGEYDAGIVIESNDPIRPLVTAPVHLHVTGAPDIAVAPGLLEFGSVFVGFPVSRDIVIRNDGTDELHVASLTIDDSAYLLSHTSFDLPARSSLTVTIGLAPSTPGSRDATLTIASDDADESLVTVPLTGTSLVPPDIELSPGSLHQSLLPFETATSTVTVANAGGSDLVWSGRAWRVSATPFGAHDIHSEPADVGPPSGSPTTPPAGYQPMSAQPRTTPGSRVLLVQDVVPWYQYANEAVLSSNGIPYDVIATNSLQTVDLTPYHQVIVASDQYTSSYQRIAAAMARIEAWVVAGGVLEFHAAASGWNSGDISGVTLPAGIRIEPFATGTNVVLVPSHPTMAGVADPIWGYPASLSRFLSVPAGATVITTDLEGHPTLVEYQTGNGFVIAAGQTLEYYPYYPPGQVLRNLIPYADEPSPRWLSIVPSSGTVAAGGSSAVTFTFDPHALAAGDYTARWVATSNDPDEPASEIGVTLHVIGTPDIDATPAALEFGTVYVGYPETLTLHVTNQGSEVLHVGAVTASDPAITIAPTAFDLGPSEFRDLQVTLAPGTTGPFEATLTIASDDGDEPAFSVPARAEARHAPEIHAAPASMSESLLTGATVSRTLTVDNTGGSDLVWSADWSAVGLRAASVMARHDRVLLIQDSYPYGTSSNTVVLQQAGIPFDIVTSSALIATSLTPYGVIIVAGEQSVQVYNDLAQAKAKIDAFVYGGGHLEFHAASWNGWSSLVELPGGMRALPQFSYSNPIVVPSHPLVSGVSSPMLGSYVSHAVFTTVPGAATVVALDEYGSPTLVEYRFGSGSVVATGQTVELGYYYNEPAGRVLANMVPYVWGQVIDWLRIVPDSGTIPAGGRADLTVTFDAGERLGGEYDAAIALGSNDPAQPVLNVPVHLHVTGAADIRIEPASIAFGEVFTGIATHATIAITNRGTDLLTLDGLTVDDPDYAVSGFPSEIPVGGRAELTVSLIATTAGAHDTAIRFTTNDPDAATVSIPLSATATVPPVIGVAPESIEVSAYSGDTVVRTVTVSNAGGSDLVWSARVAIPPAAAGSGAGVAETEVPRTPPASADTRPGDYRPQPSRAVLAPGSRVLLVQDVAPWGTTANESSFYASGLAFDRIDFPSLATVELSDYRLIVIASDQPQSSYDQYAAQAARVSDWVASGGVLEFHAAAGGWQQGDIASVTLPRGVRISAAPAGYNHVLEPSHPLLAGVADPIGGITTISFSTFSSLPAAAHALADDGTGKPTLIEYPHGAGLVIASGQTLEFFYAYYPTHAVARILANMVPYGSGTLPGWLAIAPVSGAVAAGSASPVEVAFDATGLAPGNYLAELSISSNDPGRPRVPVPLRLHVRGAPRIVVSPESIAFDPVYAGASTSAVLQVTNLGTDPLEVESIVSADPSVSVDPSHFPIETGQSRDVVVTFAPAAPMSLSSTLSIASDDPLRPVLVVPMTGEATYGPDIVVAPTTLEATVLRGASAQRSITIHNAGGTGLAWALRPAPQAVAAPPAGPATRPTAESLIAPPGFHPVASVPRVSDGSRVLIVQDNAPWASIANERILAAHGIAYDTVSTFQVPVTDLGRYAVVIVASDQTVAAYGRLAAAMPRFAEYVAAGGVLEFHAAGWGWYGGDPTVVTLPGGVGIGQRFAYVNHVAQPGHPIMRNVPEPFQGSAASHAFFINLPAGASVIGWTDLNQPNLAVYDYGYGRVVASGHALEISWDYGAVPGIILENMIPWSVELSQSWLSIPVSSGTIAPGETVTVEVTFESARLAAGDYEQQLVLESNDPDQPLVPITARLHAVRLRADAGQPQILECAGGGTAVAVLDGRASEHIDGPEAITRFAWSDQGAAVGEGALISTPVAVGHHSIVLRIEDAELDASEATTSVDVVDTAPPSGGIASPAPGACLGPAGLPVVIADTYADACGTPLIRTYDPPGGGSIATHGQHTVTVTAADAFGNAAPPDTVTFTVDTMAPTVSLIPLPSTMDLSKLVPFSGLFTSGDADGATGGVVHEVVTVDGCVVYDGATFGDGDGLLGDEAFSNRDVTVCDIARACGRRHWTNPVVGVTATDCGGNTATATMTVPGLFVAGQCPAPMVLSVTSQAGSTRLAWNTMIGASTYQVVRGNLNVLRAAGGGFHAATDGCVAAAATASPAIDTTVPAPGAGFWYLVRDVTEGIRGSWNELGPSQAGSRDNGIDTAAGVCP